MSKQTLTGIARSIEAGATLHVAQSAWQSTSAVLVWSDGRAEAVDIVLALGLTDMDVLEVIRSERTGYEATLNEDGKRWLREQEEANNA